MTTVHSGQTVVFTVCTIGGAFDPMTSRIKFYPLSAMWHSYGKLAKYLLSASFINDDHVKPHTVNNLLGI